MTNPYIDDRPDTSVVDDLDEARGLLDACTGVISDEQNVAYSLKAIAHTLLWTAEQQRDWQRKQAEATRKVEEWRAAQPSLPIPQAYPAPYQGF